MVSIDMVGVGVTLPGAVDTATLLATKSAMTHTHTQHTHNHHTSVGPGYLLILYIHHASSGLKLNSDKKYGAHVTLDVCVTLSHVQRCIHAIHCDHQRCVYAIHCDHLLLHR